MGSLDLFHPGLFERLYLAYKTRSKILENKQGSNLLGSEATYHSVESGCMWFKVFYIRINVIDLGIIPK